MVLGRARRCQQQKKMFQNERIVEMSETNADRSSIRIAYIANFYPLLSETYIVSEVKNLGKAGFPVQVFSLFKPRSNENSLPDPELLAHTTYVSPDLRMGRLIPAHFYFLFHTPGFYLRTLKYAFRHRNRQSSIFSFIRMALTPVEQRQKLAFEDRQNIFAHFFVVMPFARRMQGEGYTWMHAAFANIPASFALLTSKLCDIPYSISAHAMDLFIKPELLLEKFEHARFVVTCTQFNKTYLQEKYPGTDFSRVHAIYHGTDLNRFVNQDRTDKADPPVLLSVGRLVRKKGLGVLLKACLTLQQKGIPFQCWLVGEGPERPRLEMYCRMNQLHNQVKFWGACTPSQTIDFYRKASMFVLPCVEDENGDKDGIPNVIAEAMAMCLPVVSSWLSGIPELVKDNVTGRLLPPNDPDGLAEVLEDLLTNTAKAKRMGTNGRKRVEDIFDVDKKIKEMVELFEQHVAAPAATES
jgi:colanic acid/amylovoran biosynthesis glycosyltransferase